MAVRQITFDNNGVSEGGLILLPVPASSTESWAVYNATGKEIDVQFGVQDGQITAEYDVYRNHGDTVVATPLDTTPGISYNIPAYGTLKGTATNTNATTARTFGVRTITTEHMTGRVSGQSVWLFVN